MKAGYLCWLAKLDDYAGWQSILNGWMYIVGILAGYDGYAGWLAMLNILIGFSPGCSVYALGLCWQSWLGCWLPWLPMQVMLPGCAV
jgi:hypothetical protein